MTWYMRGGVDIMDLFYNIDVDDFEVMNKIVEENIDTTKKTQMPMI
jgi:predicted transcriptional regulator